MSVLTIDTVGYYCYQLAMRRKLQIQYPGAMHYVKKRWGPEYGPLTYVSGYDGLGGQRMHENVSYAHDNAQNLNTRTRGAVYASATFNVNSVNQHSAVTRDGEPVPVTGLVSDPTATVTVNGETASVLNENTFLSYQTLGDGPNTFTVVAQDSYGRTASNVVTVTLPVTVNFLYDGNGNLTSDNQQLFDYDHENQLTSVMVPFAWKSEFAYDGKQRRRIRREYTWSNGAWAMTNEVRYVYDGNLVIQERNYLNLPTITYTRGVDLSGSFEGAGGIGGLLARTDPAASFNASLYYVYERRGHVSALVNERQAVGARYVYAPSGVLISQSGPLADANSYRFSSKEYDANSGLYYYGYRYYEPNLQRWITRDPIGENDGVNLYAFCGNDPVNEMDTDGRFVYYVPKPIIELGTTMPRLYPPIPLVLSPFQDSCGQPDPQPAPNDGLPPLNTCKNAPKKASLTCTEARLKELSKRVNDAKAKRQSSGWCLPGDDRQTIMDKIQLFQEEIDARTQRERECWGGGDYGHVWWIWNLKEKLKDCLKLLPGALTSA